MNFEPSILKSEEKVQFQLRALYEQYGYSRFKMSKFEEYDLYGQNKEFLVSDSVITFTDTNGKLMALKPDVTLSIVKNIQESTDGVQRMYYNENVYRVSDKTHSYKEIMQAGLECIGAIDSYDLCEVLLLAAESLEAISPDCVLNLSHLGVVSALLEQPALRTIRKPLAALIGEKNTHEIAALCRAQGIDEKTESLLCFLTCAYGSADEVLPALQAMTDLPAVKQAVDELILVTNALKSHSRVSVLIDFSLMSNMNYYNGLVFRGFVKGVPTDVLRGGQYDHLMKRLGKSARAIGFAVYLDLLERMDTETEYDGDVLLTYDASVPVPEVLAAASVLRKEGKRVDVQQEIPEKRKYRQHICLPAKGGEYRD